MNEPESASTRFTDVLTKKQLFAGASESGADLNPDPYAALQSPRNIGEYQAPAEALGHRRTH